ncbi:MAG TPA: cytochrome c [Candidatus Polarisedimenticolia bacterium]|nr:cytochrome c [Candidatus Polarisedimenticolia bacterium]
MRAPFTLALCAAAAGVALLGLGGLVPRASEAPSRAWIAPADAAARGNSIPSSAESIARGKKLYTGNCLACHGESGDGQGPVAKRLGFMAGDLTDAEDLAKETDGALFWKISTGRDPMPAFKKDKNLTDDQIWDLVNYIRTLSHPTQTQPAQK